MAANPKPPQSYIQRMRTGRLKVTTTQNTNRARARAAYEARNPSGRSPSGAPTLPGGFPSSLSPPAKPGPTPAPQQVSPLATVKPYVPMGPDIAANFAQTAANIAQLAALRNAQNPPTVGSAPPKGLAGGGGRTYLGNVNYQSPGTPDTQGFAKAVLERLNAPVNANTMALMMAWFQAEGTSAKWNPMATTLRYGGSHSMPNSSVGVQEYKDMASGVAATVRTLQDPRYKTIVRLLQAGINPVKLFRQAETEFDTWRGSNRGHYGLIKILKGAR